MPWCFLRLRCALNDLLHATQEYGRSPLCICLCIFRLLCWVNDLLHTSTSSGTISFLSTVEFRCSSSINSPLVRPVSKHYSKSWTLSTSTSSNPTWLARWILLLTISSLFCSEPFIKSSQGSSHHLNRFHTTGKTIVPQSAGISDHVHNVKTLPDVPDWLFLLLSYCSQFFKGYIAGNKVLK
jgi:hypothetical protein